MVRSFTSEAELFSYLTGLLESEFDIDPKEVHAQSSLVEDLDLDSIDAVNLLIELKNATGKKVEIDSFQSVKTFGDLNHVIYQALQHDA